MTPSSTPRALTVPWRDPPPAPLTWQPSEAAWRLGPIAERALIEDLGERLRDLPTRTTRGLVTEESTDLPPALIIKEFRGRGAVARIRRIIRRQRAAIEWRRSRELSEAGVPHPPWLAWGRCRLLAARPRDILVGEWNRDALPLDELLRRCWTTRPGAPMPVSPAKLARRIGQTIGRLHRAGLIHHDLHPGNLLVTPDLEVLVVDLHRSRHSRSPRARRRDLTDFAHAFMTRTPLLTRLRFLRAYQRSSGIDRNDRWIAARDLGRAAMQSLRRFIRRREKRTLRDCRDFRRLLLPDLAGIAARLPLASRLTDQLRFDDREDFGLGGEVIHARHRARVLKCATRRGPVCVKIYAEPGWRGLAKRILRGSRAKRAWLGYHQLAMRGVEVPRPLLFLVEPWYSSRRRSMVAMAYLEGAVPLRAWLEHRELTAGARTTLRRELARALRSMHDLGVRNRDLKSENILVDPLGPTPLIVDPDGVRHCRPGEARVVAADLARLNASFTPEGPVSVRDRLQFLADYARAGSGGSLSRRLLRRDIAQRTLEKWRRQETARG